MRYRLKNRALKEKLDAISGNDFSKMLNTEAQRTFVGVLGREIVRVYFGDFDALTNRFSVIFELDELEEVPEYDPHKWNPYPEVTPPKEQDMRVEVGEGCGYMAWWDGFNWRTGNHHYEKANFLENVKRFRPWEDPDEEDKE